jgi:PAS domain S-box-containing protein
MSDETTEDQEVSFPLTNLNEQLLAFLRIANAMLEATDLDQILAAITREVSRVIEFDRSSVAFLTPDKKSLILRNIHTGASGEKCGEGRVINIDEKTVIGWVATYKTPLLRSNIAESSGFEEVVQEEPLKSDIIVPLTGRGGLIGTLNVGSYRPDAFGETDLEVMENCGRFASLAIEHTTLRLEALELSERYKTLQENANDVIMIVDRDTGRLVECNRKSEKALGYTQRELTKLSIFDLFPKEDLYQARRDFINILSQKALAFVDRRMITRDGYPFYVDINASLIKVREKLFIQMIVHNVSQRRMLEKQIINQNQRLQAANEKLMQVDQMKTEFLANISHELRTPLSIIMAYTDSLRGSDLSDEKRLEFLSVISDNGASLLALINNLLDLSRLEASGQSLSISLSHVHDVIKSIWPDMVNLAEDKKLSLTFSPALDIPVTYFDNSQLVRVFQCLIQNAIKFTEPGGYVTVTSHHEGEEVWIQITDTGGGIHKDELEHIFETFHQVDASSSRKAGGLGIGLTLARHVVELHKGRLWAESEFGVGSTFTVALPLDTEEVFLTGSATGNTTGESV